MYAYGDDTLVGYDNIDTITIRVHSYRQLSLFSYYRLFLGELYS